MVSGLSLLLVGELLRRCAARSMTLSCTGNKSACLISDARKEYSMRTRSRGMNPTKNNTLPDDVRALFMGANYAHVATLMPDGSPHNVPVWVGVESNRIAFLTSPTSRKARNLMQDPRVSISITDVNQPNSMAQVRGHITEQLEDDQAWEVIDRISHKYTGQPYPLRTDRVVFFVEPEHTFAKQFG